MPRRGGRQSLGDISLQLRIQLWDAIHHNRTLYGKKCSSIRSFFNAVDAARKGSVGRKALGAAMGRLDVGLSEAQVERLLRSMDSDNSGAVDFGAPAPALGQHTDSILEELGFCESEVVGLRRRGVV